jgi:hypothetical protein
MDANKAVPGAVAAGIAVAIAAVLAIDASGEPMGVLTRDIHSLSASRGLDLPHYAGVLSMLTIMVWTAGHRARAPLLVACPRRAAARDRRR